MFLRTAFMSSLRRPAALLALVLALLAGAGCSGSGQLRYTSAQDAFQKGVDEYEAEDYERAIEYFRAVFTYGRDNEWADDAQLYLARAYREDGRYLLAASQYNRFAQLYRSDERVPEAEYERAMAYYRLSPAYNLDQTNTERALTYFLLFSERYPQHTLASEAEAKIGELREKLARKQYEAAQQYERRELWEAAAHAYESVFDQYPETQWVDNALLGAVRANVEYAERSIQAKQQERYRRAVENYRQLTQIFPNSPLISEAEAFYETAARRLEAMGEDAETLAGTDG